MVEYFKVFWNRLKVSVFYKNIAIVAGGNITAKLIGILLTPVITRLYSPADYGVYNIFMSIIGVTGSLVTLRYAVVIPVAKDERTSDNVLKLCFSITFVLSLLWVITIFVFGDTLSEYYKSEELKTFVWLIPLVFFGQGIYEALNQWAVRNKQFRLITRTKISQSVSSTGLKIGLGFLNVKPLGLFVGHIAQEVAGISTLLTKLIKTKPTFFREFAWPEIKQVAIRYKKFPLIQSWSQLLLASGVQLPVLFLGMYYGAEVVGIFGLAKSMIQLPMGLIGDSVAQVYYAEISKLGKDNPDKIYRLTVTLIKRLFFIGLIPVAFLIILGPWLFSVVFGSEWHDAGVYARYLSIYILMSLISTPVAHIFNLYERMDLQLILNIVRVLLIVIVFVVCHYIEIAAINSIIVYSISMFFYFLFLTFVILQLVKKNISK